MLPQCTICSPSQLQQILQCEHSATIRTACSLITGSICCSCSRCSNVTLVTLMFVQSHCNIQCSPVGQVCLPSSGCSICSQSQLQQIFQCRCYPCLDYALSSSQMRQAASPPYARVASYQPRRVQAMLLRMSFAVILNRWGLQEPQLPKMSDWCLVCMLQIRRSAPASYTQVSRLHASQLCIGCTSYGIAIISLQHLNCTGRFFVSLMWCAQSCGMAIVSFHAPFMLWRSALCTP